MGEVQHSSMKTKVAEYFAVLAQHKLFRPQEKGGPRERTPKKDEVGKDLLKKGREEVAPRPMSTAGPILGSNNFY